MMQLLKHPRVVVERHEDAPGERTVRLRFQTHETREDLTVVDVTESFAADLIDEIQSILPRRLP